MRSIRRQIGAGLCAGALALGLAACGGAQMEEPAQTPDGEPVADLVLAQGDAANRDGESVTVKLVMTEGTRRTAKETGVGGGLGEETYSGRCALQAWQGENLLSACPVEDPENGDVLTFAETDFTLCFDDYNGDGDPDWTVGQWLSSNAKCYSLFPLDGAGEIRPISDAFGIVSDSGGYSTAFSACADGFQTEVYDNAAGTWSQVTYVWSADQDRFTPC